MIAHAWVGKPLDVSPEIPLKWWAAIRSTTLWHIWLTRNSEMINGKKELAMVTKRKIWYQTRLFIKAGWQRWKDQIRKGAFDSEEAAYPFGFNFGQNDSLFLFCPMGALGYRLPG